MLTVLPVQQCYTIGKTINGGKFDDLSGTTGTPSATNTSYTISTSDVGNKTTQFRAVATFTDDKGAPE